MTDRHFVSAEPGYWRLHFVRFHAADGEFKVYPEPVLAWELRPGVDLPNMNFSVIRSRWFGAGTETQSFRSSSPRARFASPMGRASPARRSGLRTRRMNRAPERKPERCAAIPNSSRGGAPFNELLAAMASAGARGCAALVMRHGANAGGQKRSPCSPRRGSRHDSHPPKIIHSSHIIVGFSVVGARFP
jgi:hypothetical protein